MLLYKESDCKPRLQLETEFSISTSLPSRLERVSFGADNLEEVPMDVVTEDEQDMTQCSRSISPTELDEIELRSRALRSLLLKKHLTPKHNENPLTVVAPKANEGATGSVVVKKLAIGSGKQARSNNSPKKFIITVCDSSDSEPESCSIKAGCEPLVAQRLSSVQSTARTLDTSCDRTKTTERQLLRRKLNLLRLRLTIKRQQRIVEERRKSTNSLFRTVTDLRQKLKQAALEYKKSLKLLLHGEKLLSLQQRKLVLAQKHYSHVVDSLKHLSDHRLTQPSPTLALPSEQYYCKELLINSLSILEQARLKTAYFYYFPFDHPNFRTRVNQTICIENSVVDTNAVPASREPTINASCLDPNIPICPFLMDGDCKDKSCQFQHPRFLSTPGLSVSPLSSNINATSSSSKFTSGRVDPNECPFCSSPDVPMSVQKWHTIYSSFRERHPAWPKRFASLFLSESARLIRQFPDCRMLTEHHISMACASFPKISAEEIATVLSSSKYPLECSKLVLRHSHLPSTIRRKIAQSCIASLLPSLSANIDWKHDLLSMNTSSFIYLCYHFIRLLMEFALTAAVEEFLKETLLSLPEQSCGLYGLWWIKLSLILTERLPSEDTFFSPTNIPSFPKSVLESHHPVILDATSTLGIPTRTLCVLNSLEETFEGSMPFNCYLAIVHLYIQQLVAKQDYQAAFEMAFKVSVSRPLRLKDYLFFPTAIYAFSHANPSIDWASLTCSTSEVFRCWLTTPLRIEFTFLHANILWRKSLYTACSSVLVELLASVLFIPSDEPSVILKLYEDLLVGDEVQPPPESWVTCLSPRALTYLWLSYSLYSLLHAADLAVPLSKLIAFHHKLIENPENDPFDRLVLHMIMTLLNRLYNHIDCSTYANHLTRILLDHPLVQNQQCLSTWLIELIQRISLVTLPSPGIRHDVCVRLVETYGWQLITGLCRTLFAVNDLLLAQSLCAICKIDKPDQAEFWLLYAAVIVSLLSDSKLSKQRNRSAAISELFEDAVSAVPSSSVLWENYVKAVVASGAITDGLLKRAKMLDVFDFVSEKLGKLGLKSLPVGSNSVLPIRKRNVQMGTTAVAKNRPKGLARNKNSFRNRSVIG